MRRGLSIVRIWCVWVLICEFVSSRSLNVVMVGIFSFGFM